MIFIFNESTGDAKMLKLIIAEPETGNSDLYVRFDAKRVGLTPDMTMKEFAPCGHWDDVHKILVRFGFNLETDQVFYFRDNKLIPALSTACYVGLFTVTN